MKFCNQQDWRNNSNRQRRSVEVQTAYPATAAENHMQQAQATATPSLENNTYRLLHAGKTCKMFNRAFHLHQQASLNCPTNLQFDFDAEQQRGVC